MKSEPSGPQQLNCVQMLGGAIKNGSAHVLAVNGVFDHLHQFLQRGEVVVTNKAQRC
jgi:hypothetical protein